MYKLQREWLSCHLFPCLCKDNYLNVSKKWLKSVPFPQLSVPILLAYIFCCFVIDKKVRCLLERNLWDLFVYLLIWSKNLRDHFSWTQKTRILHNLTWPLNYYININNSINQTGPQFLHLGRNRNYKIQLDTYYTFIICALENPVRFWDKFLSSYIKIPNTFLSFGKRNMILLSNILNNFSVLIRKLFFCI